MAPTYIYYCEACNEKTEEWFTMSQRPDFISCPKCGNAAQQGITASTFHLGEGAWERNRYTGKSNVKWTGDKND